MILQVVLTPAVDLETTGSCLQCSLGVVATPLFVFETSNTGVRQHRSRLRFRRTKKSETVLNCVIPVIYIVNINFLTVLGM